MTWPLAILLVCAGFIGGVVCCVLVYVAFSSAPFGFQDREGFHAQLGAEAADAELKLL